MWDRTSGAYFGYRVEVERRDGPLPFRVSFKALDRGAVERELQAARRLPRLPPAGAARHVGPHFPQPQSIGEGEALTLELLANPETGERIFDVVKLSARSVTAEAMHAASARASEGQEAVRRAEILGARGLYAEAAEEYKKALAVQPLDAGVHNKIGICYQYLQDDAMARREYERALELRPAYAEACEQPGHAGAVQPTLQAGRARLQEGDRDQAHARDVLEERRSRLCGARADPGRIRGLP